MNTNSSKRNNSHLLKNDYSEMRQNRHKDEPQNVLSFHAKCTHQLVDLCKKTTMEHDENDWKVMYENTHDG